MRIVFKKSKVNELNDFFQNEKMPERIVKGAMGEWCISWNPEGKESGLIEPIYQGDEIIVKSKKFVKKVKSSK